MTKLIVLLFFLFSMLLAQNKFRVPNKITTYFAKNDSSKQYILYNHHPKNQKNEISDFTLTISADFKMDVLFVFSEEKIDTFLFNDSTVYEVQLPPGKYNFLVSTYKSKHILQLYFRENIILNNDTLIEISDNEITHQNTYTFKREDNSSLRINIAQFTFIFTNSNIGKDRFIGFGYYITYLDSISYIIKYNSIIDSLDNQWAFQGRNGSNKNLYLLNGVIDEALNDTIISNNPHNWAFADFYYFFEDSITQNNRTLQVGTKLPATYNSWADSSISPPYKQRIFQDMSNPDFLFHSKFSQFVNAEQFYNSQYRTSQKRIFKDRVEHYLSPLNYKNPIITKNGNKVLCGVPPMFWNGRFNNTRDSIKISAPFGLLSYPLLFVSQSLDVINQSPFVYFLYKDGFEIKRGKIGKNMAIYLAAGAIFDTLDFSVGPGKYTYSIINDKVEVAGIAGGVQVDAEFDLTLEDKNPPYMDFFQITEDGVLTNVLHGKENAKIAVRAYDNVAIKNVSLQVESFTTLERTNLEISYNPPFYEAEIPFLEDDSYALYLTISDSSNNKITTFMDPAFVVDRTTSINEGGKPVSSFEIASVYPNPFNSRTKIRVNLGVKNFKKSKIEIYNILGKQIKSYKNKFIRPGSTTIIWDGTNDKNTDVASGVYFIYLKGGGKFTIKKCILIR